MIDTCQKMLITPRGDLSTSWRYWLLHYTALYLPTIDIHFWSSISSYSIAGLISEVSKEVAKSPKIAVVDNPTLI